MSLMRTYRRALGLSQSAFAAQLNVPLETYRPWDAGRREPPPQLLTRARTLAGYPDETVLLPLPVLALMIGVHVRTLHAAARSGRLGVAYDTRTTFRRLRPRATLKHALDFRRHYYGTQRRPPATPVPLTWASVPRTMTFNSKRCADTSTSVSLDSRAWSEPPVRPSSINGKRGNARHRLFSGSESMSFNPGSALTPSHDDPLEDSVLIRLTETAPARVASTSALEPPLRTGKSSAALTCRLSSNQ